MPEKKYELTNEVIKVGSLLLHRIRVIQSESA